MRKMALAARCSNHSQNVTWATKDYENLKCKLSAAPNRKRQAETKQNVTKQKQKKKKKKKSSSKRLQPKRQLLCKVITKKVSKFHSAHSRHECGSYPTAFGQLSRRCEMCACISPLTTPFVYLIKFSPPPLKNRLATFTLSFSCVRWELYLE